VGRIERVDAEFGGVAGELEEGGLERRGVDAEFVDR
jgi:hypothetical protein